VSADARARWAQLRDQVEHHSRRYYVDDDPEIADDEYDALFRAAGFELTRVVPTPTGPSVVEAVPV